MQYFYNQPPVYSITPAQAPPKPNPTKLVDTLLKLIYNTDRGSKTPPETREKTNAILKQLSNLGRKNRPLERENLWGNWEVSYVSIGGQQSRQPVGGLFRSGIFRILFWTRGLVQVLEKPDVLVNEVRFAIIGLIRGCVRLKGRFRKVEVWGVPNAIKVLFERPRIVFGRLRVPFGKKSEVCIGVCYLDDRVRVGLGSRGSWFVFTRPGVMESVEEEMKLVG